MTVSAAYEPLTFAGNDVTVAFSVTFPFFTGSLLVTLIDDEGAETVKTISTHYTVAGGTDANGLPATGTVTMLVAPATGESLRIERVTPRTQATVYTTNDAFPAKTTEAALDKLHLLMQEVLYESTRALKMRTADIEAGFNPVLPLVADQEGEALVINVTGDGADLTDPSGLGLDIGTVTTGAPGTDAAATITGTAPDLLLNLTIPRGNTGASGAGSGDLLAANNLSDLADASDARDNLELGTGDTPQFTGIEVGHASDTTITKASSGRIAVEGSNVLMASDVGVSVQAFHASLAAVAGVTVTAAGTALLDDANAAAQCTTLGLGSGNTVTFGTVFVANASGSEGGQIELVVPVSGHSLSGSTVTVDISGNKFRVFESGGTARGFNVDLTACAAGAATTLSGKLVSRAYGSYTASADLTTVIPTDDTIPQNTEGTEVVTASITPSSASNRVRVTFTAMVAGDDPNTGQIAVAALFRDSTANAIYATAVSVTDVSDASCATVTEDLISILSFVFEHVPGTTSSTTYKVRVGPHAGDPIRLNGSASGRMFGGVAAATLVLEELTP